VRLKDVNKALEKLGLLMFDINRGYAKFHLMIAFIFAVYAIDSFRANQKILRNMQILRIIEIILKKTHHYAIIMTMKNQYKHLNQ